MPVTAHRPRRKSERNKQMPKVWGGMLLLAMLVVLLPLESESALNELRRIPSLDAYFLDLPWRVYMVLKAAILWVPLGLMAGLQAQRVEARWLALPMVVAVGLMSAGLTMQQQAYFRDVLDILALLPGLAAGFWVGKRTRLAVEVEAPRWEGAETLDLLATRRQAAAMREEPVLQSAGARASMGVGDNNALTPNVSVAQAISPAVAGGMPTGPSDQSRHRHRRQRSDGVATGWDLSLRIGGVILLCIILALLADFPRWPQIMGLGLAMYAIVLWFVPSVWLLAVPAALPLLDLAPWTGRYFLDEFDLLMLATLAVFLLRGRALSISQGRTVPLLGVSLLALPLLISLLVGLWPLPPVDANAIASYWSPYNGLRVFKGFLWGGVIYTLLRTSPMGYQAMANWLAMGMGLGLLGVGLVGAWEHHLFAGFADQHETYRIVSTFSSMHTGGGHIEAYLVAALPFLWLATTRFRHLIITAPVMVLTAYVMLYTVARGGVLALAVVLAILMVASVRLAQRGGGLRFIAPVVTLVVMAVIVASGVGLGNFHQRFADTGRDWQTRVDHWGDALDLMDGTLGAQLFGMGMGSFPRIYQDRGPVDKQPASFGFASERGNTYFRLGVGETVYYAQRIPFSAGQAYRLEVDLRSGQGEARLDAPVCEKQMLNSRQCEWNSFNVPGDGAWHRLTRTFTSSKVGAEDWLSRPPVELFLYHPGKDSVLDVDNLRLVDADGRDVLCNGDFNHGGDCWFFKTHSHLPWHIKNVWVHVLFEQGWVGLTAFAGLAFLALYRLARAGWLGHRLAWAWLASLAGLLTVGMFDSLLDAPRLATLLVATVLLGAAPWWKEHHPRHSLHAK